MRKILLNNWGLKVISLVLAFLLWFLVVQIGDPKDDRDMGTIQVKLVNTDLLEKENKVYEILDNTDSVRVTVYAPTSVFTQLRSSDITAEADVSRLTDINTIPITFTASNANVVSIEGSHDVVKLNVEEKASKYVTLMSSTVGTVADGYVVSSLTPDQNRIEVSGPKSVVEQVRYAGVEIDVTDATTNLTANVDIKLYDVEGNEIERSNLVKNVNYVRMMVEVLATKEVPIQLAVEGTPARGYMATGVTNCEPATVRIAGSVSNLSKINEIMIPEEFTDISGENSDVIRTVDIREYIPENIKFADSGFNGKVETTIYIEPVAEKTIIIPISSVSVINMPDEDYELEIIESAESTLTLELAGLGEQILPLNQNNVAGVVDVEKWMESEGHEKLRAGSFTVPVTFLIDENINIKNPINVKVIIKEKE